MTTEGMTKDVPMTVPVATEPVDQSARDAAQRDLAETLFVEAGAGTGKTTVLVGRIANLVTAGVPISRVAAITFTEKAAAELRVRIRDELAQRRGEADEGREPEHHQRIAQALDELDGAAILTLHGFARRILTEHTVEAGLPPGFENLDAIGSTVSFDRRWGTMVTTLLTDECCFAAYRVLDVAGVTLRALRDVAVMFNENWDRLVDEQWTPPQVPDVDTQTARDRLVAALNDTATDADTSVDADDRLNAILLELSSLARQLEGVSDDADVLATLLSEQFATMLTKSETNLGNNAKWGDKAKLADLRASYAALRETYLATVRAVVEPSFALIVERLRAFTLDSARERREIGSIEFHDLLVLSRELLRDQPDVAERLGKRYERLLLDEFQDTDPLQVEIATALAAVVAKKGKSWQDHEVRPGALFCVADVKQSIYAFRRADVSLYMDARTHLTKRGNRLALAANFRTVRPIIDWVNRTFRELMGDKDAPRYSSEYQPLVATREPLGTGAAVTLLGVADEHTKMAKSVVRSAANFAREQASLDVAGTIKTILAEGWSVAERATDEQSERERPARLDDIAILIPTRTSLPSLERLLDANDVPYRLEAASLIWSAPVVRDVMLCVAAICDPTDELATVSALRSPIYGCGDDDLYLHARLGGRSFRFGSRNTADQERAEPPDCAEIPTTPQGKAAAERLREGVVAEALGHLAELHEISATVSPAALIDRLVRDRQVLEHAASWPRTRDSWRQLRYLSDQARAFSESQQGGLREFVQWARIQAHEENRASEALLPETDDHSVRILTIHAAKGLEFPIVIVAGMEGHPNYVKGSGFERDHAGKAAIKLNDVVTSPGYEAWRDDKQIADHHERIRLLYVACTRARDHLVVSLHRPAPPKKSTNLLSITHAQVLYEAQLGGPMNEDALRRAKSEGLTSPYDKPGYVLELEEGVALASYRDRATLDTTPSDALSHALGASTGDPIATMTRDEWLRRLGEAQVASARVGSVPATTVSRAAKSLSERSNARDTEEAGAEATADVDRDHDNERTASRGRFGTTVGSAVHDVLEVVDLSANAALDAGAERLAALELDDVIAARARTLDAAAKARVRRLVASALASDVVTRAGAVRHYKETHVGAPHPLPSDPNDEQRDHGEQVALEGFIDLLYECADTGDLVVVDYKTDTLAGDSGDGGIDERLGYYKPQGVTYAYCVERATKRTVDRVEFLFIAPDGTQTGTIHRAELETEFDALGEWVAEAAKGEQPVS